MNRSGKPFRVMSHGGRYLDIDLEQRDRLTALDLQANLIWIHRHVLADGRENILVKNGDKVGFAAGASFVHQQDLQSMVSGAGRALPAKETSEPHAALRPNSLRSNVALSLGTTSGTCSP